MRFVRMFILINSRTSLKIRCVFFSKTRSLGQIIKKTLEATFLLNLNETWSECSSLTKMFPLFALKINMTLQIQILMQTFMHIQLICRLSHNN